MKYTIGLCDWSYGGYPSLLDIEQLCNDARNIGLEDDSKIGFTMKDGKVNSLEFRMSASGPEDPQQ